MEGKKEGKEGRDGAPRRGPAALTMRDAVEQGDGQHPHAPAAPPLPRSGLALARRAHGRAGAGRQRAAGPAAACLGRRWWPLGGSPRGRSSAQRALSPACSPAAPPTLAARLSGGGRGSRRRGREAGARSPGASSARGGARRSAQAGTQVTSSAGAGAGASPSGGQPRARPRPAGSSHTSLRPGGGRAGGRAHRSSLLLSRSSNRVGPAARPPLPAGAAEGSGNPGPLQS